MQIKWLTWSGKQCEFIILKDVRLLLQTWIEYLSIPCLVIHLYWVLVIRLHLKAQRSNLVTVLCFARQFTSLMLTNELNSILPITTVQDDRPQRDQVDTTPTIHPITSDSYTTSPGVTTTLIEHPWPTGRGSDTNSPLACHPHSNEPRSMKADYPLFNGDPQVWPSPYLWHAKGPCPSNGATRSNMTSKGCTILLPSFYSSLLNKKRSKTACMRNFDTIKALLHWTILK